MAKNDLQGALDLLILKTLSQLDSMHGYGIMMHIRRVTDELLIVEEGSLYPALHRIEQSGWVRASWAEAGIKSICNGKVHDSQEGLPLSVPFPGGVRNSPAS